MLCSCQARHNPLLIIRFRFVVRSGPELDIWTIGLTILRCWTGRRYPVGTNHSVLSVMQGRVADALAALPIAAKEGEDRRLAKKLKEVLKGFLDMDGRKRMAKFVAFDVGEEVRQTVATFEKTRDCELPSSSFFCEVSPIADAAPFDFSQTNDFRHHVAQTHPPSLP
jgi:hypothetical protein